MKIARFDTDNEQKYVISKVASHLKEASIWLASNDIVKENNWKWAPDNSVIHVNISWGKNMPDNSGRSEHCITYIPSGSYVNDDNCSKSHYFLCQK
jgi:hypothetical protein